MKPFRLSLDRVRVERKPVAAGESVRLKLPMPPSLNNLFPTGENGGRYISARYRDWQVQAGLLLKSQRPRAFLGPVEVRIICAEPSRRADIDNRIKPLLDLLVTHAVIPADDCRFVRKVTAEWGAVEGVEVEIVPAARAAA